jgi:putative NADH-flavin reductase
MQYADTRGHLVGGQIALARIEHAQEHVQEAKKMFETAAEESRNASLIADVGAGQLQIETGTWLLDKQRFSSMQMLMFRSQSSHRRPYPSQTHF